MVSVTTEITINRPILEVAEYAGNPGNASGWYVNIKSADWKTAGRQAVGSQIGFTAEFLGRRLVYVYEIVVFAPGRKMVMRTADGPFPMETTYLWKAVDDETTKMMLRNRGYPTGFPKLIAPFMSLAMRRANQKDLKLLKSILENS